MTDAARPRGVLVAFAAVSFGYFAFNGLFVSYAPLWYRHLGFGALAIGTIASLQSATRLFAPYAWGWFADHGGGRIRLLRVAVAGALAAFAALLFARDYGAVAALVALLSVCTAGVVPLSEAALTQQLSRGGRFDAGRYGRVRVWGSIGFIASVGVAGFALDSIGMARFPVVATSLLGVLLAATVALPAGADSGSATADPRGALGRLRQPEVAWFFASTFFTVLAHQAMYAFYSLYLASLGYAKGTIGLVWSFGVVLEVLWFWFQGHWFGALSAQRWLQLAALVTALRFAAVAAAGVNPLVVFVAQGTHAITFAAQHTACLDVINRHFDGPVRGRGQALYALIGYGASGVVAGVAGGAIVEWLGYSAVFWAASAAGLAAALCSGRASPTHRAGASRASTRLPAGIPATLEPAQRPASGVDQDPAQGR